jgi:hypothetical protein
VKPIRTAWALALALILLACSEPADVPGATVADAASVPLSDSRAEPVVETPSCDKTALGAPTQKLNAPPIFPPWMVNINNNFIRTDGVAVARWYFSFGQSQSGPGFDFRYVIQLPDHEDVVVENEFWLNAMYMNARILVTETHFDGESAALTWKAYDPALGSWTPDSVLQMDNNSSNSDYSALLTSCQNGDHWMISGVDRIFFVAPSGLKSLVIENSKTGIRSPCVSTEDGFIVVRRFESGATGVLKVNLDGSLDSTFKFDGVDQIDGVGADATGMNVVVVSWLDKASPFIGLRRWQVDLSSSSVKVEDLPLVVPPLSALAMSRYQTAIMPDGTIVTDGIAPGGPARFAADGSPLLPGTSGLPETWFTEDSRAWEVDGLRVVLVGQQQVWWTDAFGNIGCAASGPCWDRAPVQCSDGNPCTADGCDAAHGGCWNEPVPDGYVCGSKAQCKSGICQPQP